MNDRTFDKTFDKSCLPARHGAEGLKESALVHAMLAKMVTFYSMKEELVLDHAELVRRRERLSARGCDYRSDAIWKYAQQVGPARRDAVMHPGADAEVAIDADL